MRAIHMYVTVARGSSPDLPTVWSRLKYSILTQSGHRERPVHEPMDIGICRQFLHTAYASQMRSTSYNRHSTKTAGGPEFPHHRPTLNGFQDGSNPPPTQLLRQSGSWRAVCSFLICIVLAHQLVFQTVGSIETCSYPHPRGRWSSVDLYVSTAAAGRDPQD
jgi:hypothetical protein